MTSKIAKAFEDPPATKRGKSPRQAEKFPPDSILVVDDEPLIRWSVTESLTGLGFVIEDASDAASALKIVTTSPRPFAAVVLDLRLPDMNDLSLLGTLRQLMPNTQLILMTAFGTPEILANARAIGADVLLKPFELSELNQLILDHQTDLN